MKSSTPDRFGHKQILGITAEVGALPSFKFKDFIKFCSMELVYMFR